MVQWHHSNHTPFHSTEHFWLYLNVLKIDPNGELAFPGIKKDFTTNNNKLKKSVFTVKF